MMESSLTAPVPEPLHEDLDRIGVPFRLTQRELIELFDDGEAASRVTLQLPMTDGFVDSQIGLLHLLVSRDGSLDAGCPPLRGTAADCAAVIADLTRRFGAPRVVADSGKAEWSLGERSQITVAPSADTADGTEPGCELRFSPNYVRPYTPRETIAIEGFQVLHQDRPESFGWTTIDATKVLMQFRNSPPVQLTEPSDIARIEITEYGQARGEAYSAIDVHLRNGEQRQIAMGEPGHFTTIAAQLANELGVELTTVEGLSE